MDFLLNKGQRQEFQDIYWNRYPFLIQRRDDTFYQNLLCFSDIEDHLSSALLTYPSTRLSRASGLLNPINFTSEIQSPDQPDLIIREVDKKKMLQYFHSGYTLILNSIDKKFDKILTLLKSAENHFGLTGSANLYLTPPNSSGFSPHWDDHSVFVLQIYGKKQWLIYDTSEECRNKKSAVYRNLHASRPIVDTQIQIGDLLYIPQGFVHSAKTTNSISVHITMGIFTQQ